MVSNYKDDWRTELYDGYLNGATFRLIRFVSTQTDDHAHCEFCWQKITDLNVEDADKEGYCTLCSDSDRKIWVCKKCFDDFKKRFGFKLNA